MCPIGKPPVLTGKFRASTFRQSKLWEARPGSREAQAVCWLPVTRAQVRNPGRGGPTPPTPTPTALPQAPAAVPHSLPR